MAQDHYNLLGEERSANQAAIKSSGSKPLSMCRLACLTAAFVISASSVSALACSPVGETAEEAYDDADVIFVGTAIASSWRLEGEEGRIQGALRFLTDEVRALFGAEPLANGKTTFEVERVLKGNAGRHVIVEHPVAVPSCGTTFWGGARYIMFVHGKGSTRFQGTVFSSYPYLSDGRYEELLDRLDLQESDGLIENATLLPYDQSQPHLDKPTADETAADTEEM